MSQITQFQAISIVLSIVTALLAFAAFHRAGRWRVSDAGKSLTNDVGQLKTDFVALDLRLKTAEQTGAKIEVLSERLTRVETTLKHVASTADIEALKADLGGVSREVAGAAAGVMRIESFLMERAG